MPSEETRKSSVSYLVDLLKKSGFKKVDECHYETGNKSDHCVYYANRERGTKPVGVILSALKGSAKPKIIIHGKGERLEDMKKSSIEILPCSILAEQNLSLPGQLDYEEINSESLEKLLQKS